MLDLKKDILDLSKKLELKLEKSGFTVIPKMKTKLAIDKSGSMNSLYQQGWTKHAIDLFLGAAIKFDDDGELDLVYFNYDATPVESIDLNNYSKFRLQSPGGGTNYVPALQALADLGGHTEVKPTGFFSKLFNKPEVKTTVEVEYPTYIGFITDGEPNDSDETLDFISELEGTNNFVQIIVLGSSSINRGFLNKLANNSNVAYSVIDNPSKCSDEDFYDIIANSKLLKWLNK